MNAARIRFGGTRTADGFLFELTGGNAALDLANTVTDRAGEAPQDLLTDYTALATWAQQAGILSPADARSLVRKAKDDPVAATRALRRARDLRETIYRLFHEAPDDAAALHKLQGFAEEAARHRRLTRSGSEVRWQWTAEGADRMLWPVVDAAVALLTSDDRRKVKACSGEVCRWLFVDQSRQGNRRWCDMSVCGNRAKARRHYARARE